MKNKIIFAFLLLISFGYLAPAPAEDARALLEKGTQAADDKQFEQAIKLFEKADRLDPGKSIYKYEIAQVYFMQAKYDLVVPLLNGLLNHPDVTDHVFELLGKTYEHMRKPEQALATYRAGLEQFPNSGELYTAIGIFEARRSRMTQAMEYWKEGTLRDPAGASNYYWLARVYSMTSEKFLAVYYGEYFMNLERASQRSAEISKMIYGMYREAITMQEDRLRIAFTQKSVMDVKAKRLPFDLVFEIIIAKSLIAKNIKPPLDMAGMNAVRTEFLRIWNEDHKDYTSPLLRWQWKLHSQGMYSEYNYWLLGQGDLDEFKRWRAKNQDKFNRFLKWFEENPMPSDKDELL